MNKFMDNTIAFLMCTLKRSSSTEIQYHKGFHLKPKAAINYTEISSFTCKKNQFSMNTIFSMMGENMIKTEQPSDAILLVVHSPTVKFFA